MITEAELVDRVTLIEVIKETIELTKESSELSEAEKVFKIACMSFCIAVLKDARAYKVTEL